jgi:hypothetical protein
MVEMAVLVYHLTYWEQHTTGVAVVVEAFNLIEPTVQLRATVALVVAVVAQVHTIPQQT